MKMLITVALILTPSFSFAQTDCRAVEFADHMEAVCTGDEKALPAPETQQPPSSQRTESVQKAAPEQTNPAMATSTAAAPASQTRPAAAPSRDSAGQQSQDTVVHRQGRQQYKNGMDEARAARLRLIDSLRQSEPAQ